MPPSDIANVSLDRLVAQLTQDEAISLAAGVGFWHTAAIPRLDIPAVKVSDGPNGVRGNTFFMGTPAKCIPSATALAATWDVELIEEVGLRLLADEAKLRSASILLAPTCNIQRNPLGGRSFESFSEDPVLSGLMAAAFVRGVQKGGIGACIKHFVGNEKENDRLASDSVIGARALREVYLMPFMLAQKYAQPWSYMMALNRVNGIHCSENPFLLKEVLRDEWGFDGMVMSDWTGTYSVDHALHAGLDLEMPGINIWRTHNLVNRSVDSRKISLRLIKERARNVLALVQKCAAEAPEILDGDGAERTRETPEDVALMRKVAAGSIVLLKNEGGALPLNPSRFKKVVVVGGNAKQRVLSGGGSAALKPSYFVSPYDGIAKAFEGNADVKFYEGATTYEKMPTLDDDLTAPNGERVWLGSFFSHEDDDSMVPRKQPFATRIIDETRVFMSVDIPKGMTKRWSLTLEGNLKPRERDCKFEFGLTVSGRAKLLVDDKLVIDNWTRQRRGETFFGHGTLEERGTVFMKAGATYKIRVQYCNVRGPADGDEDEAVMDATPAVQLGGAEVYDPDSLIDEAVKAAAEADLAIAVVGLNADWETEGYDRTTLDLPGRTNELVEKVVDANPNTVVVTQSGSAITMPWADKVPAILHAWYLGNATGDAIADVLIGKVNPAGKLSMTFPKRLEDVPSHGHFNSENGRVWYSEDLFVGYKHYQHRKIEPQWAFGHGLSYTTFEYSDLELSKPIISGGDVTVTASVTVKNSGSVSGSEVVQVYVRLPSGPDPGQYQVPRSLRAFVKVHGLGAGESRRVEVKLDKYAVSYWEPTINKWVVEKAEYVVEVGASSEVLPLRSSFIIERGFEWNGI